LACRAVLHGKLRFIAYLVRPSDVRDSVQEAQFSVVTTRKTTFLFICEHRISNISIASFPTTLYPSSACLSLDHVPYLASTLGTRRSFDRSRQCFHDRRILQMRKFTTSEILHDTSGLTAYLALITEINSSQPTTAGLQPPPGPDSTVPSKDA
jgi:hypothetical protein